MIRLLFCLLFFIPSFADKDYTLINSIPFKGVHFFSTDNLGNAFVIVENQVLEFNSQGKPVANYSDRNYGELRSIDATNPMKIVLFYPDFATIVVLNSKLAVQSTVNLRAVDIAQPLAVCNSHEDGYWLYDRQDDQLKKIDLNLQVFYQSGNLSQVLGYSMKPVYMTEADGFVYIQDAENGILVFDNFGAYYKTLPLKGVSSFQVVSNELVYSMSNSVYSYGLKTIEQKEILLPQHDSIITARFDRNELYLLTTSSLNFYSF
jgi:hypothetical protein